MLLYDFTTQKFFYPISHRLSSSSGLETDLYNLSEDYTLKSPNDSYC
jgi:hypothetical protein